MSLVSRLASGLALVVMSATSLVAQPSAVTPPAAGNAPGVGQTATHPSHVDKGQNMILPSAGNSGQSAAPTMVYDCQKKPSDCSTPATPADKVGADEKKPIKP